MSAFPSYCFECSQALTAEQEDSGLAFCSLACREPPVADRDTSSPHPITGNTPSSSLCSSSPSFRYQLLPSVSVPRPRNNGLPFTRLSKSGNDRFVSANFSTSPDAQLATYGRAPSTSVEVAGHLHSESILPDSLALTSAIYRDHYPKFATRSLPRRSPMQILHPAPQAASSLVIGLDAAVSQASPHTIQTMRRCKTNPLSSTSTSFLSPLSSDAGTIELSGEKPSTLHRSPFLHIPERRSAPKRSIELTNSPPSRTNTLPFALPSDKTGSPTALIAPLPRSNALGLELEHSESVRVGRSGAPAWIATPPTGCNSPARTHASHLTSARKSHRGSHGSNPISPPSCRSPLFSIQIANALADLDMQDEGRRSVEAAAYVLGEREATYIARRLAEEQRRRAAREREKAAMDKVQQETRGRSRDRKRANTWSADRRLQGLQPT